jgi:hypothetical protein
MKQRDEEVGGYILEDILRGRGHQDDWVDPSVPSPSTGVYIPVNDLPPPAVLHALMSTPAKRNGSTKGCGEIPVPVLLVKIPSCYPQEHLPFPVTAEDLLGHEPRYVDQEYGEAHAYCSWEGRRGDAEWWGQCKLITSYMALPFSLFL